MPPRLEAICGLAPIPTTACFCTGFQPLTVTSLETSAADARGRNATRFSRILRVTAAEAGSAFVNLYDPSSSQKR